MKDILGEKKGCSTLLEDKESNIYLTCMYNRGSAQLQTCSCCLQHDFRNEIALSHCRGQKCDIWAHPSTVPCSQPSELGVCRRTTHYCHHLLKINNVSHFRILEPNNGFLDHFWYYQKLMSLVWAEIELHIHFNIRHKTHAYVCLR